MQNHLTNKQGLLEPREEQVLEIILSIVALSLGWLLYYMQGYRMVILHLYFLPVALGGFFLGRYRAGVLALFCVICASIATALRLLDVAATMSPLVVALAVTVWAAVLGLTALLIGTLSDDRMAKLKELHEAYVGVVEVLAQYLQNANPRLKARSIRVAELGEAVAGAMKLSPREIDDVRVAALLHDIGSIEITTKVIRRAVDNFGDELSRTNQHTFQGADLIFSLGTVLNSAIPLLLNQDNAFSDPDGMGGPRQAADVPIGARILRTVRAYCTLTEDHRDEPKLSPAQAIEKLCLGQTTGPDAAVLAALGRVVAVNPEADDSEAAILPIDALDEIAVG
jgi:HD-GYP domain-containing protein (c-di-GMP phosphodiesterase class II)